MDLIKQLEQLRLKCDVFSYDSTEEEQQEARYGNEMLDRCLKIVQDWLDQEGYLLDE